MGLFDRLRKKKDTVAERKSIFEMDYPIDTSDWREVYSACLGKMMAVQEACNELVVKNQGWNVDFSTGQLMFGNASYPVQFIGSESSISNTWNWGWNNINGFSDDLLILAQQVKTLAEQWQLQPLQTASLELDETFNGHNLAIVACGISNEPYCYYRGPHDSGAVLMAFSGVPDKVFEPVAVHSFMSIVTRCIQDFDINHKIFVEAFLMWNQTSYEWIDNTIVADFSQKVNIVFESVGDQLRIASIKTV